MLSDGKYERQKIKHGSFHLKWDGKGFSEPSLEGIKSISHVDMSMVNGRAWWV
jgi:hypothetical protein